jgi:hypothetical protein
MLMLLALAIVVIALVQPWWILSGQSTSKSVDHMTQVLLSPPVMIETTDYENQVVYEVAEMPEVFLELLEKLVLLCVVSCVFLGAGVVLKRLHRRYSMLFLAVLAFLLLTIISVLFYVGISKLSEVSIGEVCGEGMLNIAIGQETVMIHAGWGFSLGFYLIVVTALLALGAFLFDMRKMLCK